MALNNKFTYKDVSASSISLNSGADASIASIPSTPTNYILLGWGPVYVTGTNAYTHVFYTLNSKTSTIYAKNTTTMTAYVTKVSFRFFYYK